MKIVGHRGARGLETQNTLESLKTALSIGVDMVEFDVWTSRDGVPIVFHDSQMKRLTGHNGRISNLTSSEINRIKLKDGKRILQAGEALDFLGTTPSLLEIKDKYLSSGVLDLLDTFGDSEILVNSSNHNVLVELKKQRPQTKLYASTIWHPLETVHFIKKHNLDGMCLHYGWLNPIVYMYCQYYQVDLIVYIVNRPWHLKFLMNHYPKISIGTDYPDRAMNLLQNFSLA
jgi:glycerophosphoryl diester phosphodiesterase